MTEFAGVYQDILLNGVPVHTGRDCQSRLDMILPHVAENSRVLDVGSHSGYFAIELARQKGCHVDSFESEAWLADIQRWAIERNCVGDLVNLRGAFTPDAVAGQHYDVVLLLSVLQYFPTDFLLEMVRVGDRTIIEFPTPEETDALYHVRIVELSPFDTYLRTLFSHVELIGEPDAPYMAGVKRGMWLCER